MIGESFIWFFRRYSFKIFYRSRLFNDLFIFRGLFILGSDEFRLYLFLVLDRYLIVFDFCRKSSREIFKGKGGYYIILICL